MIHLKFVNYNSYIILKNGKEYKLNNFGILKPSCCIHKNGSYRLNILDCVS